MRLAATRSCSWVIELSVALDKHQTPTDIQAGNVSADWTGLDLIDQIQQKARISLLREHGRRRRIICSVDCILSSDHDVVERSRLDDDRIVVVVYERQSRNGAAPSLNEQTIANDSSGSPESAYDQHSVQYSRKSREDTHLD